MRALILAVALVPFALAADTEPGGKLDGKLTVKDLQGGFAGFNGPVYTIEPNGSYTVGNEGLGKVTVTSKGKLDGKALAKLAAALKKYGAGSLKNTGRPMANPRQITVTYGRNEAVLSLPTTADLPKADEKDAAGRFAGVVNAVTEALPKGKGKGGEEK